MNNKPITFISHNIQGITQSNSKTNPSHNSKIVFLEKTFNIKSLNFVALQETGFILSPDRIFRDLSLAIYSFTKTNRSSGVALYFSSTTMKHIESCVLIPGRLTVSLFVRYESGDNILIFNVYNDPNNTSEFIDQCDNIIQCINNSRHLQGQSPDIFILGDLNINILKRSSISKRLIEVVEKIGLRDISNPEEPTWQGHGRRADSSSKIDYIFSDKVSHCYESIISPFSDHLILKIGSSKTQKIENKNSPPFHSPTPIFSTTSVSLNHLLINWRDYS